MNRERPVLVLQAHVRQGLVGCCLHMQLGLLRAGEGEGSVLVRVQPRLVGGQLLPLVQRQLQVVLGRVRGDAQGLAEGSGPCHHIPPYPAAFSSPTASSNRTSTGTVSSIFGTRPVYSCP